MLLAQADHEKAVRALSQTVGPVAQQPPAEVYTANGKKITYALNMSLLHEGLDKPYEEQRKELEGHRQTMENSWKAMVDEESKLRDLRAKVE